LHAFTEMHPIDRVPVSQQIPWCRVPWKRPYDLLSCPVGGGMSCHLEVDHLSAAMAEDHQYKQDPEFCCRDREKVD